LTALLGGGGINSYRSQALQMILALLGVHYVHSLVATLESIPDERQQNAVFFLVAVKEGADMTILIEQ